MMETLTDRITRYLLMRLRRRAVLALYERAAEAGLLASAFVGGEERKGTVWTVSDQAMDVLTGNLLRDRKIVARLMGANTARRQPQDASVTFEHPVSARQRTPERRRSVPATDIEFSYVAALLRKQLPPPNPVHAVVALLVARAVGTSLPELSVLMNVLRPAAPFVLLKAPVPRFELCLGMMIEDGLVLPFPAALDDVLRESSLSGRYRQQQSAGSGRKLRTLSGIAVEAADDQHLRRQLRQALLDEPAPILLVDETQFALTPVVTETADLVLECTGIDRAMIAELLHVCSCIPPKQSLVAMEDMDFDPKDLALDDIALAVRPGRTAGETLSILAMLAKHSQTQDEEESGEDHGTRKKRPGRGKTSETSSRTAKTGKKQPRDLGIEVIEPISGIDVDTPADAPAGKPLSKDRLSSVETLVGYGPARDWALDLKADLALWRQGKLRWDEMSTKLLLSGPPGTGKTTFARALCNSLQVPLLVTSVAHWLEPGYLGDVLQRMSGAFACAAQKTPAILFVDEIDNIGARQGMGSKNHDDYWTSLINRLLELLDGVSKSEGVIIVGATNLPEKIDPALLRSGRMETHVRIPMPDTEALIGILGHHLGADLEAVLASAPVATVPRRLRPPRAIDGKPLRRGKPSPKISADKGVRHD